MFWTLFLIIINCNSIIVRELRVVIDLLVFLIIIGSFSCSKCALPYFIQKVKQLSLQKVPVLNLNKSFGTK
jgi:hypothetical protein